MRVFEFDDYRGYLKAVIGDRKARGRDGRGLQTRLAEAAGCSASFLSQALGGTVQLTPEHAHGIARALGLADNETEHLLLLVRRERAAGATYRAYLDAQIRASREREADLATRLPASRLQDPAHEALYYSSWVPAAIHIALSVPTLRTPAALAERFGLTRARVEETLASLESMGLARAEGARWRLTDRFLHLSRHSPAARANHAAWRLKAMENIQRGFDTPIQYSSVFSIARDDIPRLEELVRRFIEESRALVAASPEEEVACFLMDLFRV